MNMQIDHAKLSLLGDRQDNQDRADIAVTDEAVLMVVFDGMGGHSDGALAAEVGLKTVRDMFEAVPKPVFDPQGFLYMALSRAHDAVVAIGAETAVDFRPRATCAICLVQDGGSFWAHVGDSRIYHLRKNRMLARSRDHSHVEVLIQEGAITEEQALDHPMRNFVECCIGGDAPVPNMMVTAKKPLQKDDVLLVCSDGLWSGLTDEELVNLGTAPAGTMVDNLKMLSTRALSVNSPYSDNTTTTALRWLGD